MNARDRFLCAILTLLVLTTFASCATTPRQRATVTSAAAANLLNTQWRLTQLGAEVIPNTTGPREVNFTLESQAPNVTGFSGCNRITGRYVLETDSLKFDGLGGTRAACVGGTELERRYLAMFGQVRRWKITGQTLELEDGDGKTLAIFQARPAAAP